MTLPRVFGLGSHHGDDRAGWLVIERLRELGYPPPMLRQAAHPADFLDDLSSAEPLLICDACENSGSAGTIHRWRWPSDSLKTLRSTGTHDLPLAQVLELADQFAEHRLHVEVWGITGSNWNAASQPSPAVHDAAGEAAAQIWRRYSA